MSAWNYRVIVKHLNVEDMRSYTIHECYYAPGAAPDSVPTGWSAGIVYPAGTSIDELIADMKAMTRALDLPLLRLEDGKLEEF